MNHSKPLILCLLLGLFPFGVWAQQSTSEASTWIADGVPACRAADSSLPDGVYRVGPGVPAPAPKYMPDATPSEEARRFVRDHNLSGFPVSLVRLTVDERGMPKDICILKVAGHGLDKNAFDTVVRYPFQPATLRGKPVPVRVTILVNFGSL
jgi:Gram-negative bacterial TonB protein C-terminal